MLVVALVLCMVALTCLFAALILHSHALAVACIAASVVGVLLLVFDAVGGRSRTQRKRDDDPSVDVQVPSTEVPPWRRSRVAEAVVGRDARRIPTDVPPARSPGQRGVALVSRLMAIGTGAVVRQAILGRVPITEDWADVAKDVVTAIVEESTRSWGVGDAPSRDPAEDAEWIQTYETQMMIGRRFLMDLPDDAQFAHHRDALIQQAVGAFVRASVAAQQSRDTYRYVQAEAAVAGCWLWVPSPELVAKTLATAIATANDIRASDSDGGRADAAFVSLVDLGLRYGAVDESGAFAARKRLDSER